MNGFQQPIRGAALAASNRFRTRGPEPAGGQAQNLFCKPTRPFKREQLRLSTFPCET